MTGVSIVPAQWQPRSLELRIGQAKSGRYCADKRISPQGQKSGNRFVRFRQENRPFLRMST
jgi:hypothetical protein